MPIDSHVIEVGAVQRNGMLSIVERYFRDDGSEVMFTAQVDPGADLELHASKRIAAIDAADEEAQEFKSDPLEVRMEQINVAYARGDTAALKAALEGAVVAIEGKDAAPIKVTP